MLSVKTRCQDALLVIAVSQDGCGDQRRTTSMVCLSWLLDPLASHKDKKGWNNTVAWNSVVVEEGRTNRPRQEKKGNRLSAYKQVISEEQFRYQRLDMYRVLQYVREHGPIHSPTSEALVDQIAANIGLSFDRTRSALGRLAVPNAISKHPDEHYVFWISNDYVSIVSLAIPCA